MKNTSDFFDKPLGELVIESLEQANAFVQGRKNGSMRRTVMVSPPPDYTGHHIRDIRMGMNMSQSAFASLLGVSKKTIEAWESEKSSPIGPARRLLDLLEKDGNHVRELINA